MALFDRNLIRKYDRPGPRYTSYPPAPRLHESFGSADLQRTLTDSNGPGRPLSLYVHIPFCRSLCLYCGCNVVITNRPERVEAYLDEIEREMARVASHLDPSRPVTQLAWGGGTPTHLSPDQIRRLGESLRSHFRWADDIEASVEIDPRRVTHDHVCALREVGFNRASIGVQDIDPTVQATVHRLQPIETTRQVLDWCRAEGFRGLNVDLMYGLPYQTPASYEHTLDAAVALAADRYAVFNYAHVPWLKRHQAALPVEAMPSAEDKLTILEAVIARFTAAGYAFIGMDHFARPDDELAVAQRKGTLWRNFQGYTTRKGCDLIGLGVTALGLFDGVYYQNERELPAYYGRLERGELPVVRGLVLTEEDRLRRDAIMALMCHFKLEVESFEAARPGLRFWEHFAAQREAMTGLEADGLLELSPRGIFVTERGRMLIRNVAMVFDEYLAADASRFSRTV